MGQLCLRLIHLEMRQRFSTPNVPWVVIFFIFFSQDDIAIVSKLILMKNLFPVYG